jgi:hypothetical protein
VTLGNQTIGTTLVATTATALGATFDTTLKSTINPTSTPGNGQTFTLTTGSDVSGTLVGSAGTAGISGNDSFVATNLTYNNGDVIVGGDGTDTLTVTSTAAITATPTVVGVENTTFNISTATLVAADVALTNISLGTVTVNQLQAGAAATSTVTGAGNVTLAFGTGITGFTYIGQTAATNLVVNAGSATVVDGSGSDATITNSTTFGTAGTGSATTGSLTINGGALTTMARGVATTGSVTLAGDALTTLTAVGKTISATTKAGTTAAPAAITLTGVGVADAATVSIGAAATVTNTITSATTVVETLTISTGTTQTTSGVATPSVATLVNGSATTYNITGANAITVASTQVDTNDLPTVFSGKTVNSTATGVAKIELTIESTDANTEDLLLVAPAVAIEVKGTANAADALSVANNATVNAIANLTTDLAIALPSATSSTNVLNLGVSADQTAGITVTNAKTININVTANSYIDVGDNANGLAAGTANVFVSGSKNLTLGNDSVASKVDATGFTGILTATAGSSLINSIVGGSGNDVITLTSAQAVTVDGGAGTADTINLGANNTVAVFSNFEIAQMVDGANAVNVSQFSGKAIAVKGNNGSDTLTFATAAKSIDAATIDLSKLLFDSNATGVTVDGSAVSSSLALGATFTLTGSAIADNVNFDTNTAANTFSTGAGSDTISAGSGADIINGGADNDVIYADNAGNNRVETVTITYLTATSNDVLTVNGVGVTFATGADLAAAKAAMIAAINAEAALKNVVVASANATAGVVDITYLVDGINTASVDTTSANNTNTVAEVTAGVAGATANNVLTGGTGTDTFVFGAASTTPSDSIFNTITDFATASDIIDYAPKALTIVTNTTAVSGTAAISSAGIATFNAADSTLALRIVATEKAIQAGTATAGQAAAFQYGSDAYVFISEGTDNVGAGDQLIKLTGVDLTNTAFDTLTIAASGNATLA